MKSCNENICKDELVFYKSMFTWDPKLTQTGLRFHFGAKLLFGIR